ncbi:MAG: Ig-like domain-containing protein [Candidatus Limnocylindria bacterium]
MRARWSGALVALALLLGPAARPAAALPIAGVAVADALAVKHDRTAVVPSPGVLGNDLNISLLGGTSAVLLSDVSHGDLILRLDGGYTYTPDAAYVGTDVFRYRPSGLLSTPADVTITMTNATPVARSDAYAVTGRTTLVVAAPGVLGNDTDADGDVLVAKQNGGGVSGSLDLASNGGFTYSPGGGFSGNATFEYQVWDGIAWSATTTVTLTIAAATPPPTPDPPPPTPRPTASPPSSPPPDPTASASSSPAPERTGTVAPEPTPDSSAWPGDTASRTPSPPSRTSEASPSEAPDASDAAVTRPASSASASQDGPAGQPGPQSSAAGEGGIALGEEPRSNVRLVPPRRAETGAIRVSLGPLGLLGSIDVWSIPGLLVGVPGLLVIGFVLLQAAGALAWIPAIRRLRGARTRWPTCPAEGYESRRSKPAASERRRSSPSQTSVNRVVIGEKPRRRMSG